MATKAQTTATTKKEANNETTNKTVAKVEVKKPQELKNMADLEGIWSCISTLKYSAKVQKDGRVTMIDLKAPGEPQKEEYTLIITRTGVLMLQNYQLDLSKCTKNSLIWVDVFSPRENMRWTRPGDDDKKLEKLSPKDLVGEWACDLTTEMVVSIYADGKVRVVDAPPELCDTCRVYEEDNKILLEDGEGGYTVDKSKSNTVKIVWLKDGEEPCVYNKLPQISEKGCAMLLDALTRFTAKIVMLGVSEVKRFQDLMSSKRVDEKKKPAITQSFQQTVIEQVATGFETNWRQLCASNKTPQAHIKASINQYTSTTTKFDALAHLVETFCSAVQICDWAAIKKLGDRTEASYGEELKQMALIEHKLQQAYAKRAKEKQLAAKAAQEAAQNKDKDPSKDKAPKGLLKGLTKNPVGAKPVVLSVADIQSLALSAAKSKKKKKKSQADKHAAAKTAAAAPKAKATATAEPAAAAN